MILVSDPMNNVSNILSSLPVEARRESYGLLLRYIFQSPFLSSTRMRGWATMTPCLSDPRCGPADRQTDPLSRQFPAIPGGIRFKCRLHLPGRHRRLFTSASGPNAVYTGYYRPGYPKDRAIRRNHSDLPAGQDAGSRFRRSCLGRR